MSSTATRVLTGNSRRHAIFVAFIVISSLTFYKTLRSLIQYSLATDSSSHIILIPFISIFLLYVGRQKVFAITRTSVVSGVTLALTGIILYWLTTRSAFAQEGNWQLSMETLSVVLVWIAGFLLCYGFGAFRAGAFPLLFLLLMVPLPDVILNRAIYSLQAGSAEISYLIFQLV